MISHLGELISATAARHGARTALVSGERTFTYAQLDELIGRFAAALCERGIAPGDRVTLYAMNCWQWVVAYHAVLRAGAVINPINMMLTAKEVAFVVGDCGAIVLITSADKYASLRDISAGTTLRHLISFGGEVAQGWLGFEDLLEHSKQVLPAQAVEPGALSTIAYTSGTTGHPKGAMHSHGSVVFNSAMTATMHVRTHEDVVVSALPCPHVYGNVVMNSTFMVGGTLVLHPRFDAAAILESIERRAATLFEGVPTMYFYLLVEPGLASRRLSSLTRCTVGGQTMPVAKMNEVEQRFGCPLLELWGMTELAGLGSTHAYYGSPRLGSIGIALPYTALHICAVDDAARELAANEVGELMAKGPHVMLGYYNNERATRETIEADGWLHTGDLAYQDELGRVFIVDRKKDMIVSAGYKVYPAEIERVLAAHEAVAMVAVGSIPDELKGEVAKAYVVLKANRTVGVDQLLAHCRGELAGYKVPREIQFVSDLPKTSTGKILRRELRSLPP